MLAAPFASALVLLNLHAIPLVGGEPNPATDPTAVTIVDGRFAYVGRDAAAARKAATGPTEVIDLAGRTVVPGFNDAHVHLGMQATLGSKSSLELGELERDAWLAAIADGVKTTPGTWLFVRSRHLPAGVTAADLDRLGGGRPIFIASAHGGLINRAGQTLAGFAPGETDFGFVRGRLLAASLERIASRLPPAELEAEARTLLAEFARLGITSAQLIDDMPDLFERLRVEGALTARIRMIPLGFRFDSRFFRPRWKAADPDWMRVDGVKYFHDDGARLPRYEISEIVRLTLADQQPFVVHVLSAHALDSLLDFIEPSLRANPRLGALLRIEHVDEASPRAVERLAHYGITVCQNPAMRPEWRKDGAFPMRSLLAAGVRVCIGSDWVGKHTPARPLDPFFAIAQAMSGKKETLTLTEALTAYTVGSAHAEGDDGKKGQIALGQLGDLAVLSEDPYRLAPTELERVHSVMTVVGGRIVHREAGIGVGSPTMGTPRGPSIGPVPTPQPSIGPVPPPRPPAPPKRR